MNDFSSILLVEPKSPGLGDGAFIIPLLAGFVAAVLVYSVRYWLQCRRSARRRKRWRRRYPASPTLARAANGSPAGVVAADFRPAVSFPERRAA